MGKENRAHNMTRVPLFILCLACTIVKAQLPALTASKNGDHENVHSVVYRLPDRTSFRTLMSLTYEQHLDHGWTIGAEVSGMPPMIMSGPGFVSRDQHVTLSKHVKRVIIPASSSAISRIQASLMVSEAFPLHNGSPATSWHAIKWDIHTRKKSSFTLQIDNRRDKVHESFSVKDREITSGDYNFTFVSGGYRRIRPRGINPYLEFCAGGYYGSSRTSIRPGTEHVISKNITQRADFEYTSLRDGDRVSGALIRYHAELRIRKNVTLNLFCLRNTFHQFTAFLATASYSIGAHNVRMEYRDLRDKYFTTITTDNFFFASNVLLQYLYRLP
jgi:hypothetical protein